VRVLDLFGEEVEVVPAAVGEAAHVEGQPNVRELVVAVGGERRPLEVLGAGVS
jgi:hypothetical protein